MQLIIVHEVPGRIRARYSALEGAEAQIVETARELPGLQQVAVRPKARSVVFEYDLDEVGDEDFRQALASRFDLQAPLTVTTMTYQPRTRTVAEECIYGVRRAWGVADRTVYGWTGGLADLRSTVPWLLAAWSLRQIMTSRTVSPLPWYNALYYSLQAILRYPDEAAGPYTAPPAPPDGDGE